MWNAWIEECCLNPESTVEKAINVLRKSKEGRCLRSNYWHRAPKMIQTSSRENDQTLGSWLLDLGPLCSDKCLLGKGPRTQDPEPEAERRKAFTSLNCSAAVFPRIWTLLMYLVRSDFGKHEIIGVAICIWSSLYLHKQLFKRLEDEAVSGCDCRLLNTAIMNKKCPVGPTFATNIIKKFRSD